MRRLLSLSMATLLGVALARLPLPPTPPAEAAPAGPPPEGFSGVVERAEPGVVTITTRLERPRAVPGSDEASPLGSPGGGFVYSADGLVVTSKHMVDGARVVYVDVVGHGRLEAQLVATDPQVDLAVLRVPVQGLSPLPIGDPATLRVGSWVLAVGNPYGLGRSWSAGIVSGLHRDPGVFPEGYEDFIQTDAAVNVGNSGGPVLDAAGRVVGMATALLSRTGGFQGIGLAMPIDVIVDSVEQLRATGRVRRSSLGVVVRSLPGGVGLQVARFLEDSPARRAGLREGDVLLRVDDARLSTKASLQRAVWPKAPGSRVRLEVWRNGQSVLLESGVSGG